MDCRIRVTTCKAGDRRLLDEVFELKPIKREGKIPFQQLKKSLKSTIRIIQCVMEH